MLSHALASLLLLDRLIEAHLWQRLARVPKSLATALLEGRQLVALYLGHTLFRLVQSLHLDIGISHRVIVLGTSLS